MDRETEKTRCATLTRPCTTTSKSSRSKSKRKKNNNNANGGDESENADFISRLPNDILVYLLSFVEMETAARTSLLSKRWRNVWTHLMHLDFKFDIDHPKKHLLWFPNRCEVDKFIEKVNQVIAANRAPYLNTFRIRYVLNGRRVADIDKWIEFALSKKIRNLELNFSTIGRLGVGDGYKIRRDFLCSLSTHDYHTTLKSLHLEALYFEGSVLEYVLHNCINLERLTVWKCRFYSASPIAKLVVYSIKLRHLVLCRCCDIKSFQISAPKLTNFTYFAAKEVKVEYRNVPSLVNVTFGSTYCHHIFYNLHVFSEFSYQLEKLSLHWGWDHRKEWETNVREIVKKRSLLPRMIYLSMQCVSASIKENIDANGSVSDSAFSLEMKSLLERYVKILGCSFDEAVKVLLDVAEGQRPLEALGSDLIEWVSFAVFLNAWSLSSHESVLPTGEESTSLWHLVNSLLQKCTEHKVRITGPRGCSLGGDLPVLVQLIGEPVAWHCLVLQSFIRSSLPCGKKKKKSGGPADSSTSVLSQTIRDSVSSLYSIVEVVVKWLNEEVNKTDEEAVDHLLSFLVSDSNEGPGKVYQALKDLMSTADEGELGDRIFQGINSWSPTDIARKTFKGQHKMMSSFLQICNSKLKLLEAVKLQI